LLTEAFCGIVEQRVAFGASGAVVNDEDGSVGFGHLKAHGRL
jgi:ribosomal protein S5